MILISTECRNENNNVKSSAQNRGASGSVRYNYVCESNNTNKETKQDNIEHG